MTDRTATPDGYFDDWWARSDDPWSHATRWSEARKYGLTVASLPRLSYRRSFEPGCGVGILTEALASRSSSHLALERHPRGVTVAAARCARHDNVAVRRGRIPDDWPDGRFDLVVLSEVLYYLSSSELDTVLDAAVASLEDGGDLVAVHYRRPVAEHAWTGDEVHDRLVARPELDRLGRTIEPDVVIDVLRR